MSNSLSHNPVYLDTFHSDVTIFTGPGQIKSIYFQGTTIGDTLSLEDSNGQEKIKLVVGSASGSQLYMPSTPIYTNGLVLDVSNGVYAKTASSVTMAWIQI